MFEINDDMQMITLKESFSHLFSDLKIKKKQNTRKNYQNIAIGVLHRRKGIFSILTILLSIFKY